MDGKDNKSIKESVNVALGIFGVSDKLLVILETVVSNILIKKKVNVRLDYFKSHSWD